MAQFYNPNNRPDPRILLKQFYNREKLLIILMALTLVLLIISESRFFNIIYLVYLVYFGGVIFKQFFTNERLISQFVFGGLSGAAVYLMVFNAQINPQHLLSAFAASAGFSLLAAAATKAPKMEIPLVLLGKVKLQWLAIIFIGLDLLTINPMNPSLRLTDLGGVVYGFLSIYFTSGLSIKMPRIFKKKGPYYKRPKKAQQSTYKARPERDEDYNARKLKEQKEVDKILERIKKSGYESLSAEEKAKLFDQSKKL